MAKKVDSTDITVTLPFLRETKNTYVYGFEREALEALEPKPAVSSLYINKSAGGQRDSVTLVIS